MMKPNFFWYSTDLSVYTKETSTGIEFCMGKANTLSQASHFVQFMTDRYKETRLQMICHQRVK